mmetsp:Transcript_25766/g.60183  ORF Transcript_25766/g.60183 Transcript_25766/m.60183 type:complete len:350 (-) Transcript_25766:36-1085(-)|eukprot:CAMPEP_0178437764 /NCGR_PEP_ID=MMETSP0689_2-20121128/35186_1 /TAXON_ID=160604 /ORGANISM="Amphidinium massartii, Strain CS-259" /LENGTH=349 /DNA_ID=CAMNT_0020060027 /DNA_START=143 /DNA_END=1192 /DNA_ORIENTATION=+
MRVASRRALVAAVLAGLGGQQAFAEVGGSCATASERAPGPGLLQISSSVAAREHSKFSSRRHVYIDMGANWANTLRLYRDIAQDGQSAAGWEVYAFEADPIIQPYLDKFVTYLNGGGEKPALTIPPSGSTAHLKQYGPMYGCNDNNNDEKMRNCMLSTFMVPLMALRPDPSLNSTELVKQRMAEAGTPLPMYAQQPRFTFIPAAVGSEDDWLHLGSVDPAQAIRGGAIADRDHGTQADVIAVDTVSWLIENFSEDDYIVLKMDVEGAEFEILSGLYRRNKLHLIDLLAYECHNWARSMPHIPEFANCHTIADTLQSSHIQTLMEGAGYQGWDSFSTPDKYKPEVPPPTR